MLLKSLMYDKIAKFSQSEDSNQHWPIYNFGILMWKSVCVYETGEYTPAFVYMSTK